jgi:serine/threonine protein kinase
MSLAAGTRLGPYEIVGPLGAGGMGEVYRARDTKLDRDVALEVLPVGALASGPARARLVREARLAASLNHPSICTVHDVDESTAAGTSRWSWLTAGRWLN